MSWFLIVMGVLAVSLALVCFLSSKGQALTEQMVPTEPSEIDYRALQIRLNHSRNTLNETVEIVRQSLTGHDSNCRCVECEIVFQIRDEHFSIAAAKRRIQERRSVLN
jgi:hypothetical protein